MVSNGFLKAFGSVTGGAIFSRVLGFVREMALAARFGASPAMDAYLVASLLPVTLFLPVASSLTAAFIPAHARRMREGGREDALHTTNSLINLTLLVALVLATLLYAMAPQFAAWLAPGFGGDARVLTAHLIRWMAPATVFLGLGVVVTGFLQARERFLLPALAGLPMNAMIIVLVFALGVRYGITAAATGALLGAVGYLFVQLPGLRGTGFRYHAVLDLRDPGLRQIGRMLIPIVVGAAAGQIIFYASRILASGLAEGSISALNYATRVAELPYTIFAAAIVTVIYPSLSRLAAEGDMASFRRSVAGSTSLMLFVITPMAAGLMLLREPVVRLLFERGAFDIQATHATAVAVLFYAIGLVPASLTAVWSKALYSLGDTRSPMLAALAGAVVNVGLNALLVAPLAHAGLALATSLAQTVGAILTWFLLLKRVGSLGGAAVVPVLVKVVVASLIMAIAVFAARSVLVTTLPGQGLVAQAFSLFIPIVVGAAVYMGVCASLGLEQTRALGRAASRLPWKNPS